MIPGEKKGEMLLYISPNLAYHNKKRPACTCWYLLSLLVCSGGILTHMKQLRKLLSVSVKVYSVVASVLIPWVWVWFLVGLVAGVILALLYPGLDADKIVFTVLAGLTGYLVALLTARYLDQDSTCVLISVTIGGTSLHDLGIHGNIASLPSQRAKSLRSRFLLQSAARRLLPSFAVSSCMRVPVSSCVHVLWNPEVARAHYALLQTCKSVHVCPVCATTICERRKQEIHHAATSWQESGGSLVMATFTLQHAVHDSLADIAGSLNSAYRFIKSGKKWAAFVHSSGLIGSIAATEYTHGEAGWHPHKHVLLFTRSLSGDDFRNLEAWLKVRWSHAIGRLGRFASLAYGVDCKLATANTVLTDYLVKATSTWTIADEVSKANVKQSRRVGRTPMTLLSDSLGDSRAGELFREYANWTYRKNHLVWSLGLKAHFNLAEQSDEGILLDEHRDTQLVVVLDRGSWYIILANDIRLEVLLKVEDDQGKVGLLTSYLAQFGVSLDALS